ncbi:hypothetical protein MTO96_001174, partial [Rhipicephalus appendiculatus]
GEGIPPGLREVGDPPPTSIQMEETTSRSAKLPESSDSSTEEAMESPRGIHDGQKSSSEKETTPDITTVRATDA